MKEKETDKIILIYGKRRFGRSQKALEYAKKFNKSIAISSKKEISPKINPLKSRRPSFNHFNMLISSIVNNK